jgi:hypothetical protein
VAHEARTDAFAAPTPLALDPSVSFPDYAASTIDDPQPGWRTLNAARERAFTGEIKFHTTPGIVAYVDGGSVYYAERIGEPPLGQRLLAAGVVTAQQLDRGVVRVGGAEHLGRLFDRDETVDRDSVMVVVEAATETLVTELAAGVVTSIEVSAYRHHQSGVHRWFVAPTDASRSRPVSAVAQVDRSVIDELPDVTTAPVDVTIEWDHPAPAGSQPLAAPSALDQPTDIDVDAEFGPYDIDEAEWSIADDTAEVAADDEAWLGEFQIVWPDGTEEPATSAAPSRPTFDLTTAEPSAPPASPPELLVPPPSPAESAQVPSALPPSPGPGTEPPPGTVATSGLTAAPARRDEVRFAMPQIIVDSVPAPDAEVPDDVANAVRRALQAIENAAVSPASLPQIDLEPLTLPDLKLPTLDDSARADDQSSPASRPAAAHLDAVVQTAPLVVTSAAETEPVTTTPLAPGTQQVAATAPLQAPAPTAMSGFAPPSADMRAEAIYARAAAAATSQTALGESTETSQPHPTPEPGQASVVFVDEEDDDGSSRKGALRRLIGSLRKSD